MTKTGSYVLQTATKNWVRKKGKGKGIKFIHYACPEYSVSLSGTSISVWIDNQFIVRLNLPMMCGRCCVFLLCSCHYRCSGRCLTNR